MRKRRRDSPSKQRFLIASAVAALHYGIASVSSANGKKQNFVNKEHVQQQQLKLSVNELCAKLPSNRHRKVARTDLVSVGNGCLRGSA